MEFTLTSNQQQCFDAVENSSQNFLILGEPGVGKSVLIRALAESEHKNYALAAPTGLAALNINGRTIHSMFKIPSSEGIIHPTYDIYLQEGPAYNYLKYQVKSLIIDEVSMLRADMFDYIDRCLKSIKKNWEQPFGGVQIIAIGDFYQLPPVVKGRLEAKEMREVGYSSPFIFSSKVFKDNFTILNLNEVLRQKGDPEFVDLLAAARTGSLHPKHAKILNKRVAQPTDLRIKLTCTNDEADAINQNELRKIDSREVTFQAMKMGEWPTDPVAPLLKIKVGAQVMVKMNGADKPNKNAIKQNSLVVNGTLGIVTEIFDAPPENEDGKEIEDVEGAPAFQVKVNIRLEKGQIVSIYWRRWERKIKIKNAEGEWDEKVVASYEQMPLQLAWAISIHKSQGQSFDKAHINLERVFAPGQAYVAISRVRSMAGITLEKAITTSMFTSNQDVDAFFQEIEINKL